MASYPTYIEVKTFSIKNMTHPSIHHLHQPRKPLDLAINQPKQLGNFQLLKDSCTFLTKTHTSSIVTISHIKIDEQLFLAISRNTLFDHLTLGNFPSLSSTFLALSFSLLFPSIFPWTISIFNKDYCSLGGTQ